MRKVRGQHEEHANHERWVIPYADLLTLLLAFFVVMYALSSINEGKYRVLAASLTAAFTGSPHTIHPIEVGKQPAAAPANTMIPNPQFVALTHPIPRIPLPMHVRRVSTARHAVHQPAKSAHSTAAKRGNAVKTHSGDRGLKRISDEIESAFAPLIKHHLVTVRRRAYWLEMEIKTDILFPSGQANLASKARPVLQRVAGILGPFPNPVRVEGYTDDRPIKTSKFPSNWELSAARAASVARLFVRRGLDPERLGIIGWGQYRPAASNSNAGGRNRNRRVMVVVLSNARSPAQLSTQQLGLSADGPGSASAKTVDKPRTTLKKFQLRKSRSRR